MNRYILFDAHGGLFEDDHTIFANTSAEAVRKYMKKHNLEGKPVRSGGRYVRFKITKVRSELVTEDLYEITKKLTDNPIYETSVSEQLYKIGNSQWYMIDY